MKKLIERISLEWVVSGTISDGSTGQPLERNLTVAAYYFDYLTSDDSLGKAVPEKTGRFQVPSATGEGWRSCA